MTAAANTLGRLVFLAAVVFFLLPAVAHASECGDRIVDDWWDNATIDGTYPIHCYREAIASLPEDVRSYSSAEDDIRRALQERLRGDGEDGGGSGETTGGSSGSTGGGSDGAGGGSVPPGEQTTAGSEEAAPGGAVPGGGSAPGDSPGSAPAGDGSAAPAPSAFEEDLGDGGSSLPLPVIVVLAVVALGAAAFAARYALARRGPGGDL